MNFKAAQFENFCTHPDQAVKCVVLFGPNEGEIATLLQKCVKAICGDINDSFNFAQLDMDAISKDGGEIYAEYHAQSLMGGRRIIVVKNADNSLTPFLKDMLPESPSNNLLLLTQNMIFDENIQDILQEPSCLLQHVHNYGKSKLHLYLLTIS